MLVTDFDYDLPDSAIAQSAIEPRDAARLLRVNGDVDYKFFQLPELLDAGDVLVVNRTRVRAARLRGSKIGSGGSVELLLLRPLSGDRWEALMRPSRRLRTGIELSFGPLTGRVISAPIEGVGVVELHALSGDVAALVEEVGEVPLPPYFHGTLASPDRYQTVFAAEPRSAAAPTAALHFTPRLCSDLEAGGVEFAEVELDVGLDTFRPMQVDRVADHEMHRERFVLPNEAAQQISAARRRGNRVIAVGTTAVRTLETMASGDHQLSRAAYHPHCARRGLLGTGLECGVCRCARARVSIPVVWRRDVHRGAAPMNAPVHWMPDMVDGRARTGVLETPHGSVETPAFMPVATRGSVKGLDAGDLRGLGAEMMLANTYHLALRPGEATVAGVGGIQEFTGWRGPILTDSGGYQVFSLAPRLTEEEVVFRSVYDGSQVRLSPERAMGIQEDLGSDIAMALDVLVGLPAPRIEVEAAMRQTLRWAERALAAKTRDDRALFGIVQGGTDPQLRAESASATAALGFDGYGIGGLSVGEGATRKEWSMRLHVASTSSIVCSRPGWLVMGKRFTHAAIYRSGAPDSPQTRDRFRKTVHALRASATAVRTSAICW
jgi:S-adenosylmethionine:tRNA ribosyltransferase-isomerase